MVEIMAAPGHTPGQVNFWIPEAGILLAGDNILGNSTSVVTPPDGDLGEYMATLQTLRELKPRLIGPGHGDIIRDPDPYIAYYLDHRRQRTEQILTALGDAAPKTALDIAQQVYQEILEPEEMWMGEQMVQGHLRWLQKKGWVTEQEGRLWRKAGPDDFS